MDITRHNNEKENAQDNTKSYVELAIRILTGFLLIVKGYYFISHSVMLENFIRTTMFKSEVNILVNYIGFAHMLGGALIILGLLTRVAVILQIPIIIGAIYYNLTPNTFAGSSEILLSIVVLVLLVYILIKGSGKISMDYYRKRKQL